MCQLNVSERVLRETIFLMKHKETTVTQGNKHEEQQKRRRKHERRA